jgi:methionine-rich copper-binding protein CopC
MFEEGFRSVRRLLFTVLLATCVMAGTSLPATAHNVLKASDPKDGATLTQAPRQITLVFDQPVRKGYATVSVTGPDGAARARGAAVVAAEKVTVEVAALPVNGEHVVGYRVLSADGHPITGKITFTLTVPATASPETSASSETSASPETSASSEPAASSEPLAATGVPAPDDAASRAEALEAAANGGAGMAVLWIAGALLVLAAGTVVALRRSRPDTVTHPDKEARA